MKKIIFVGFSLICVAAHSQSIERSVTAASGNYFYQAGTGSVSFTVGENAVTTLTAPNNILTQGFQQQDTSEITFVLENDVPVSIYIFPNPVSNFLSCKINNEKQFHFSIYDGAGRLIEVPVVTNQNKLFFDVSKIAAGNYLLAVTDLKNKNTVTKKFIKQ